MTNLYAPLRGEEMSLEDAFPAADPGAKPLGERVLVQLRTPKRKSSGGIMLVAETQDQDKWMTSIGRVVALGPLAFRDRLTMEPWPEGVWVELGDFVRVPKHGGDRWEIALGDESDAPVARFVIYRDRELIGKITGDPMKFKDYV